MKNLNFYRSIFVLVAIFLVAGCATTGEADASRRVRFTNTPEGALATMPDSILFAVNSVELYKQTDELFDALKPACQSAKGKFIVKGHTDNSGSASYNLKLSQQRAEAVKAALVARQIAPSRIEAKGYGMTRPIVANAKTPEEMARNRRAEIIFVGETVESIGGNKIEKALSDIANKISGLFGSLLK